MREHSRLAATEHKAQGRFLTPVWANRSRPRRAKSPLLPLSIPAMRKRPTAGAEKAIELPHERHAINRFDAGHWAAHPETPWPIATPSRRAHTSITSRLCSRAVRAAATACAPATRGSSSECAWNAVTWAVAILRRTSTRSSISAPRNIPLRVRSNPVRNGRGATSTGFGSKSWCSLSALASAGAQR